MRLHAELSKALKRRSSGSGRAGSVYTSHGWGGFDVPHLPAGPFLETILSGLHDHAPQAGGAGLFPPTQPDNPLYDLVPVIRLIVDCVSDVPQLLLGHPEVMPQLVHDRLADLGLDIAVGA